MGSFTFFFFPYKVLQTQHIYCTFQFAPATFQELKSHSAACRIRGWLTQPVGVGGLTSLWRMPQQRLSRHTAVCKRGNLSEKKERSLLDGVPQKDPQVMPITEL